MLELGAWSHWSPGDPVTRVFFSARLEHVVLVDDERANFRNDSSISAAKVLRYCKVRKDSVLMSLICKIRGFVMVQECEWR